MQLPQVTLYGLLHHLLHSLFKHKYRVLPITLLLSMRKVFQHFFFEANLIDFTPNAKVLKTIFIKLPQVNKLEEECAILHFIFNVGFKLNKSPCLELLLFDVVNL